MAKQIVKECNLDKVVMVPVGNHYPKEGLIEEEHRYNMLKIATKNCKVLEISDIELHSNKTLMPIEIFEVFDKIYNQDEIYFILGADNLYKIKEELQNKYNYIVIKRKDYKIPERIQKKDNIIIIQNETYAQVSSSMVRMKIKEKQDLIEEVSKEVLQYIKENKLFQNS